MLVLHMDTVFKISDNANDARQAIRRSPGSLPEDVPVIAGGEYPFARAIQGAKRAKITNYCKFPAPVNHQKGTIFSK
jgi:hypothetical protein